MFDNLDDPRKFGLLMAGLQMAMGRGRTGENIAGGLLGGLQAYQGARAFNDKRAEEQQQRELRAMQIDQAKRGMQEENDIRSLASRAFAQPKTVAPDPYEFDQQGEGGPAPSPFTTPGGGGLPAFAQGLMGINPMKAVQFQQALAKDSPFGKVDPDKFTPESIKAFMAGGGKDFSVLRPRSKVEVSNGLAYDPYSTAPGTNLVGPTAQVVPDGKGGWAPNPAFIALAQAKRPQITVDTRQETEFAKKMGGNYAEEYTGILKAGQSATNELRDIQRFEGIVSKVPTGKLEPLKAEVSKLANGMGIKVDTDKLGFQEALESMSNQFALTLRNPSGGAGMPGALSDKDREFLVSMVPSLAKTPQGNQIVLEAFKRTAQRKAEVAQLARDYVKSHGRFDDGFYNELEKLRSKDIMGDLIAKAGGGSSGTTLRFDSQGRPLS